MTWPRRPPGRASAAGRGAKFGDPGESAKQPHPITKTVTVSIEPEIDAPSAGPARRGDQDEARVA